jgi:hypothetical protein
MARQSALLDSSIIFAVASAMLVISGVATADQNSLPKISYADGKSLVWQLARERGWARLRGFSFEWKTRPDKYYPDFYWADMY